MKSKIQEKKKKKKKKERDSWKCIYKEKKERIDYRILAIRESRRTKDLTNKWMIRRKVPRFGELTA